MHILRAKCQNSRNEPAITCFYINLDMVIHLNSDMRGQMLMRVYFVVISMDHKVKENGKNLRSPELGTVCIRTAPYSLLRYQLKT